MAMQVQDLIPNQTVGLSADAGFRGVYYGLSTAIDPALGEIAVVYVSNAGATGRKQGAVTLLAICDLAPVQRVLR